MHSTSIYDGPVSTTIQHMNALTERTKLPRPPLTDEITGQVAAVASVREPGETIVMLSLALGQHSGDFVSNPCYAEKRHELGSPVLPI